MAIQTVERKLSVERGLSPFGLAGDEQLALARTARELEAIRRRVLIPAAFLLLTGCQTQTGETASTPSAGDGYPVTVEDGLGPVTVANKPERIASYGAVATELLAICGARPRFQGYGGTEADMLENFPYVEGLYDEFSPTMVQEFKASPEALGALQPDFIIGTASRVADPAKLKQIAPAYLLGDENWRERVSGLGKLLGNGALAEAALAKFDQGMVDLRKKLSGLDGTSYVAGYTQPDQITLHTRYPWDTKLGWSPSPVLPTKGFKQLSFENLDQLNADTVILWDRAKIRAKLEANPEFSALPAVKNGTLVWVDGPVSYGLHQSGPVGIPWSLAKISGQLETSKLNQKR